uniref:Predicted protein n=1 Tax=Hordeum vulgare subsp. vulgare TaxID=112509 RepID=F2E9G1_HORVV|nr:predicted protein [Hordeum vulgare subsp. vulgare]
MGTCSAGTYCRWPQSCLGVGLAMGTRPRLGGRGARRRWPRVGQHAEPCPSLSAFELCARSKRSGCGGDESASASICCTPARRRLFPLCPRQRRGCWVKWVPGEVIAVAHLILFLSNGGPVMQFK